LIAPIAYHKYYFQLQDTVGSLRQKETTNFWMKHNAARWRSVIYSAAQLHGR